MADPRCATTTPLEATLLFQTEIHRSRTHTSRPPMRACTLRYATTPWQKGHDLSGACHPSRTVRRPNSAFRASPEVSAEVWLDPTDLTVPVILERSSRLRSNSNKLELFAIDLRQLADGALRFGTTQHFTAVFAASGEVPECESGQPHDPKVMRGDEAHRSPTYVVGTPRTEVLDRDCFTSGSQDDS
jgi:hypothetical protein